jgi:hypothetical protein
MFHTYIASVFFLYVAKVDINVTCVCNDFQMFSGVFRRMLQVFQLFWTYVASISSGCCKSRYDVAHVAIGPPAAAAGCTCRGAVEQAQNVPTRMHVENIRGTSGLRVL